MYMYMCIYIYIFELLTNIVLNLLQLEPYCKITTNGKSITGNNPAVRATKLFARSDRISFFTTCQVRVVRFCHSCSGSSSSFSSTSSSSSSFYSTTSASTSTSTSALPTLRSSPTSARSGHCWTSTAGFRSDWARLDLNRKVLSAAGTARSQPGTFRA